VFMSRLASPPEAKPSVFVRDSAVLLLLPPAFRQLKQAGDVVQPLDCGEVVPLIRTG
jgi:hypothetical protein